MPEEFSILVSADVSGLTSAMAEASSAASSSAEAISAAFEASGAQIHDFADEMTGSAGMSAEAMAAWREESSGLGEGLSGLASSTEETVAAIQGVPDVTEASAAGMATAAEASGSAGSAMEGLTEKSGALTEVLAKMTEGWAGILGAIGGGAVAELMNHIAETTLELGSQMRNVGAQLGITVSEARGFIEAMEQLHVSVTGATMAVRTLQLDAENGGKKLATLGISARDATGAMKSGNELFTETIDKLRGISDAGERGNEAMLLMGRGGRELVGAIADLPETLARTTEEQLRNKAANEAAETQMKALARVLTEIGSAFKDNIIAVAPAVVSALKTVEAALQSLIGMAQAAAAAIQNVFGLASKLGGVMGDVGDVVNQGVVALMNPADHVDHLDDAVGRLNNHLQEYKDSWKGTGDQIKAILTESEAKSSDLLDQAGHRFDSTQRGLVGGLEQMVHVGPEQYKPFESPGGTDVQPLSHGRGGGGHHKGGKGGGADPMAGTEDALVSSQQEMDKLSKEFAKLGSEAQTASKASEESFNTIRDRAKEDYQQMQASYKQWADAVKSGDAEAAKAFQKDWKDATKQFQADFDEAKRKAQQDMQQIKSTANTISSEISGILNQAITGKVNWQQEFGKILSKMADELVKYATQMVVAWITHQNMMQAAQAAGQGNMIGQLINWLTSMTGARATHAATDIAAETTHQASITAGQTAATATQLGIKNAANAAQLAASKAASVAQGTTDAGLAAANTIAALTPIPYIGPALAAATAPEMFALALSYSSAAGGMDVPAGRAGPLTQLHPSEMVLPAEHADTVRRLGQTGGARGGGGGAQGNFNQTLNIQSLDPSRLGDILSRNMDLVGGAVARWARGGAQIYTG